ncbi:MAG: hypothetical protein E7576_14020 [Ruminococcaceae bacterium]|nr:hypothetical protein [Oscillospiraceae bacterium]
MLRICRFTMVPIHIGTGSLNQPQVIPDLPAKEVANASHLRILNPDFVGEGKKRYAFLDLMAMRRADAVALPGSREGHQLWPQVPLPGVPLGRMA